MSSSHKKVIVRRFAGDLLSGYLALSGFLERSEPAREDSDETPALVQLLDLGGRLVPVPLDEIKMVSYVRDFNLSDTENPERLLRRSFLARPRAEGLWVRLTFRSGDLLEGLAPLDVSLADDLLRDGGLHLMPPDTRSNTQRIYVPRLAMSGLHLLGVVTSPSRRKAEATAAGTSVEQEELFRDPSPARKTLD